MDVTNIDIRSWDDFPRDQTLIKGVFTVVWGSPAWMFLLKETRLWTADLNVSDAVSPSLLPVRCACDVQGWEAQQLRGGDGLHLHQAGVCGAQRRGGTE